MNLSSTIFKRIAAPGFILETFKNVRFQDRVRLSRNESRNFGHSLLQSGNPSASQFRTASIHLGEASKRFDPRLVVSKFLCIFQISSFECLVAFRSGQKRSHFTQPCIFPVPLRFGIPDAPDSARQGKPKSKHDRMNSLMGKSVEESQRFQGINGHLIPGRQGHESSRNTEVKSILSVQKKRPRYRQIGTE